jgi:hypothetical protein
MAGTIRLNQIGDYAKKQMEKLLRAAVLETDSLLKQASPVDTGRFRASWQVGENSAGSMMLGHNRHQAIQTSHIARAPSSHLTQHELPARENWQCLQRA